MKRIVLMLAMVATMALMLAAFSGPVMADEHWNWEPWWLDGGDVTDVDWEYWPGYGYYPEDVEWVDDGYAYELEFAPCGNDLCITDWDRDAVEE
ncbi:MAG: hypothetical protein M3246_06410 [Actinomycetota bacterium]|nr:hypothetical protein [Actinomycetota bacterium]